MKFRYRLLWLLFALNITVFAQDNKLMFGFDGKVVIKDSEEVLPLANVILFSKNDSTQFSGTVTNDNGIFEFSNIPNGNYYLEIRYIGFKTHFSPPFQISGTISKIDLGVFEMEVNPLIGKQIEATAARPGLEVSIDRKIYNVEKDVINVSGSATDILQNIPSVTVDIDGNISLRGTENVAIFINGNPSLLMRKNKTIALQQIPANTIERVEVITNPSAKYKPDGIGGIINIIVKKETDEGINGTIIANAGNEERYNANVGLNYSTGEMNLFGSYGLRKTNYPRTSTDTRINKNSLGQVLRYENRTKTSGVKPLSHAANIGFDYTLNENNRISTAGSYYYRDSYHTQNYRTIIRDSDKLVSTDFNTDRTNDEFEEEFETSLIYEHESDDESSFEIEINYSGYDEREDNHYNEKYSAPSISEKLRHILINKDGQLAEIKAEWVKPIGEDVEITTGYAGEYLRDNIQYLGEDFNSLQQTWVTDFNKTNRFRFNQDIHAFYLTYGQSIDEFSFLAGLRAEQAFITSNLVSENTSIPNDYFYLFPTLHLAYELSDRQEMQLNYSRRVNRADSDEHNPFAEYSDPRNMEAGNPKIKPEQIHSVEMGYHLKNEHFTFLPSLYYRYKYDAFSAIRKFVNDSTLLTTFANLETDQFAGFELILNTELQDYLSLNFSGNAYYRIIDISELGNTGEKDAISWNAKLAANLHFVESSLMQIYFYYRSARLISQGEIKPRFLVNFGMRQNLYNNKLSLTFTASDVFRTLDYRRKIDTVELFQEVSSKRNTQIFYFGLTYRFGSVDEQDKLEFDDKI